MHAVVVRVTVHDVETAQAALQEQVVPRVQQAPGFVAGYWTRSEGQGLSMVVFESEEHAQQAADLVKSKSPKEMSFAEWELVLSAGKPEDADKVWQAIKGVPLQMEGQVITATPTKLEIAGSSDDIDKKRSDIMLDMSGTIPDRMMPKVDSTLDFEGTPVSYTASPFVMMMEKERC